MFCTSDNEVEAGGTMSLAAAFRWDSSSKEISFLFLDSNQFQLRGGGPQKFKITNLTDIDNAIDAFVAELHALPQGGIIEFHILNHASPVVYTRGQQTYRPSQFSTYVEGEFHLKTTPHANWVKQSQLRKELKKPALTKFKKGLKDLSLWAHGQGAWVSHLWALSLHCTKGSHKKELRNLWATFKQATGTNAQKKQQFDIWYQQL